MPGLFHSLITGLSSVPLRKNARDWFVQAWFLRQLVLSLFERNLSPEFSRTYPEVTGIRVLTTEAKGRNLRSLVAAFARILTYAISCFGSLMPIRQVPRPVQAGRCIRSKCNAGGPRLRLGLPEVAQLQQSRSRCVLKPPASEPTADRRNRIRTIMAR
jgi:hypothetical protein